MWEGLRSWQQEASHSHSQQRTADCWMVSPNSLPYHHFWTAPAVLSSMESGGNRLCSNTPQLLLFTGIAAVKALLQAQRVSSSNSNCWSVPKDGLAPWEHLLSRKEAVAQGLALSRTPAVAKSRTVSASLSSPPPDRDWLWDALQPHSTVALAQLGSNQHAQEAEGSKGKSFKRNSEELTQI